MNQPITAKMGVCEVNTMSRYIDADALKKRVSELIVPDWTRTLIRSWLDSEPTVDAVQVVRCGKCKYFVKNTCECVRLADRFGDEYSDAMVYPEYYCADGERRSDGNKT